jgi:hypothetical protein
MQFDKKDTVDMFEYVVTLEGHQVVAHIANFWPSELYIDGDLHDTYQTSPRIH